MPRGANLQLALYGENASPWVCKVCQLGFKSITALKCHDRPQGHIQKVDIQNRLETCIIAVSVLASLQVFFQNAKPVVENIFPAADAVQIADTSSSSGCAAVRCSSIQFFPSMVANVVVFFDENDAVPSGPNFGTHQYILRPI